MDFLSLWNIWHPGTVPRAAGRKLHMYVQTGLCEKVCTFEHMNMAVYILASI